MGAIQRIGQEGALLTSRHPVQGQRTPAPWSLMHRAPTSGSAYPSERPDTSLFWGSRAWGSNCPTRLSAPSHPCRLHSLTLSPGHTHAHMHTPFPCVKPFLNPSRAVHRRWRECQRPQRAGQPEIWGGFLPRATFKMFLEGRNEHPQIKRETLPVRVSSLQFCLNIGINYKYRDGEAAEANPLRQKKHS